MTGIGRQSTAWRRAIVAGAIGVGQAVMGGKPSAAETIAGFWPIEGTDRAWNLVGIRGNGSVESRTRMTVALSHPTAGEVILWFSNKEGQLAGEKDLEHYRLCDIGPESWVFLDEYIKVEPGGKQVHHPVQATRIVYSPQNGAPVDLVSNRVYAQCGGKGQPYLRWNMPAGGYRIQVWGTIENNASWKWYWDAVVHTVDSVANNCTDPPEHKSALMVQEAWWATFSRKAALWNLGDGEMGSDGMPTGRQVEYGRSVWHGAGRMPYYLTGAADGLHVQWCEKSAWSLGG